MLMCVDEVVSEAGGDGYGIPLGFGGRRWGFEVNDRTSHNISTGH